MKKKLLILLGFIGIFCLSNAQYDQKALDILDAMSDEDISLFVEILNVEKGVYELPVKAALPKKVLLEKADPEIVKAAITAR